MAANETAKMISALDPLSSRTVDEKRRSRVDVNRRGKPDVFRHRRGRSSRHKASLKLGKVQARCRLSELEHFAGYILSGEYLLIFEHQIVNSPERVLAL